MGKQWPRDPPSVLPITVRQIDKKSFCTAFFLSIPIARSHGRRLESSHRRRRRGAEGACAP